MADGTKKPIRDVRLSDRVMAKDPLTDEKGSKQVTHLIRSSGPHVMVAVHLADGTTIDATDHHPFWVRGQGKWIDAIDLKPGDQVETADGHQIAVAGVGISNRDLTAYNLSIANLHTYYAGNSPVLVHNAGCDEWAADFVKRTGGEANDIKTFENPMGRDFPLGPYRPGGPGTPAVDEDWFHHTVVVRDRQVFDQWHPDGVGIDEYKQMFDYHDDINFGF